MKALNRNVQSALRGTSMAAAFVAGLAGSAALLVTSESHASFGPPLTGGYKVVGTAFSDATNDPCYRGWWERWLGFAPNQCPQGINNTRFQHIHGQKQSAGFLLFNGVYVNISDDTGHLWAGSPLQLKVNPLSSMANTNKDQGFVDQYISRNIGNNMVRRPFDVNRCVGAAPDWCNVNTTGTGTAFNPRANMHAYKTAPEIWDNNGPKHAIRASDPAVATDYGTSMSNSYTYVAWAEQELCRFGENCGTDNISRIYVSKVLHSAAAGQNPAGVVAVLGGKPNGALNANYNANAYYPRITLVKNSLGVKEPYVTFMEERIVQTGWTYKLVRVGWSWVVIPIPVYTTYYDHKVMALKSGTWTNMGDINNVGDSALCDWPETTHHATGYIASRGHNIDITTAQLNNGTEKAVVVASTKYGGTECRLNVRMEPAAPGVWPLVGNATGTNPGHQFGLLNNGYHSKKPRIAASKSGDIVVTWQEETSWAGWVEEASTSLKEASYAPKPTGEIGEGDPGGGATYGVVANYKISPASFWTVSGDEIYVSTAFVGDGIPNGAQNQWDDVHSNLGYTVRPFVQKYGKSPALTVIPANTSTTPSAHTDMLVVLAGAISGKTNTIEFRLNSKWASTNPHRINLIRFGSTPLNVVNNQRLTSFGGPAPQTPGPQWNGIVNTQNTPDVIPGYRNQVNSWNTHVAFQQQYSTHRQYDDGIHVRWGQIQNSYWPDWDTMAQAEFSYYQAPRNGSIPGYRPSPDWTLAEPLRVLPHETEPHFEEPEMMEWEDSRALLDPTAVAVVDNPELEGHRQEVDPNTVFNPTRVVNPEGAEVSLFEQPRLDDENLQDPQ